MEISLVGPVPGCPELGQDDPQQSEAGGELEFGRALLLHPSPAHAHLTLGGQQPGGQRCAVLQERADESQEVSEQLAKAPEAVPKVPEEVEDGIHESPITQEASDGNLA